MIARDIPLAIGTDSLASCPDLDLLAEAALLAECFPEIEPHQWVQALCSGGSKLLNRPDLGSLELQNKPGVLSFRIPDGPNPLKRLLDGTRWERYWAA
jgi:cytosine/adenosine deaminase-related metal-dependent hydrolase